MLLLLANLLLTSDIAPEPGLLGEPGLIPPVTVHGSAPGDPQGPARPHWDHAHPALGMLLLLLLLPLEQEPLPAGRVVRANGGEEAGGGGLVV